MEQFIRRVPIALILVLNAGTYFVQHMCSYYPDSLTFCYIRPHIRKRKRYQNTPSTNTQPNTSSSPAHVVRHDQQNNIVLERPASYKPTQRSQESNLWNGTSENGVLQGVAMPESQPMSSKSYLGRAAYIPNHVPIDEDDARKYHYPDVSSSAVSEAEITLLWSLGALQLPPRTVRESLLKGFMDYCHPWMPLLDDPNVEQWQLEEPPSLLLMYAILTAGSKVSTSPSAIRQGQIFYTRARALFRSGIEQNMLTVIISTVFLQWWNPTGPEHVSMDNSSFWLRIGVGLAHQMGLHREPDPSLQDKGLRRKLWWTLVVSNSNLLDRFDYLV